MSGSTAEKTNADPDSDQMRIGPLSRVAFRLELRPSGRSILRTKAWIARSTVEPQHHRNTYYAIYLNSLKQVKLI